MGLFEKEQKRSPIMAGEKTDNLHKNLRFAAIEQYKLLRANLDFTIPYGVKCPIIGVTSSVRGEGKSTTAVNLSYVLAERGSKVLLIDGDMRIPSIAKKMNISNTPGLTDFLRGEELEIQKFKNGLLDEWYIVPSGKLPPNPSELLGSKKMEAILTEFKSQFDYIVIDLPPLNIVSDALSVANMITGMIVVIRENYTEKKELGRCFRQLKLSNVNVLGCVMNETKLKKSVYKNKKYRYYNS